MNKSISDFSEKEGIKAPLLISRGKEMKNRHTIIENPTEEEKYDAFKNSIRLNLYVNRNVIKSSEDIKQLIKIVAIKMKVPYNFVADFLLTEIVCKQIREEADERAWGLIWGTSV